LSADNSDATRVADHDILAATFDQMKTATADFISKSFVSDLFFNLSHGPTHNTARPRRLGCENHVDAAVRVKALLARLHVPLLGYQS